MSDARIAARRSVRGVTRSTARFGALLAVLVAIGYANSFGIGFHFDDIQGIAENPAITTLRNIPRFLSLIHI